MKNKKLSLLDWAAITVFVLPPVALIIKFITRFDLPYISFENKLVLYSLVLIWNMSLGYLMFKR